MDCADDGHLIFDGLLLEHLNDFKGGRTIETGSGFITQQQIRVSYHLVSD